MKISIQLLGLLLAMSVCNVYSRLPDDQSGSVVVSLKPGQDLKGLYTTSASGDTVYKFYGIPYAAPPTGHRRFRPPQPPPDWSGVKDAVTKSPICPQANFGYVISEDCLYLNVFTPDVNASLPVLVWIHGGGYVMGSAFSDGDGATLAPRGVVAVTINYRLGLFGFLSLADSVMPGYYGMLDQVMALKWVQKNIRAFGGDPNQVTIGGESAGADAVSVLILSPLAKGLFTRAIMESGFILALGFYQKLNSNVKVRDSALQLASRVRCNQTTSPEILQCLQAVDASQLLNATQDVILGSALDILPDNPLTLLRNGNYNKVDTLQGMNSGEVNFVVQDPEDDGVSNQQFKDTVTLLLTILIKSDKAISDFVNAYIGNETDPIALRSQLVHAVSDIVFGGGTFVGIDKFVSDKNDKTKHFLYEFDYRMSGTPTPAWRGVEHTLELRFVFYPDAHFNYSTADDRAVGDAVQTMWVNFIKYGNPTPPTAEGNRLVQWKEYTKSTPYMLKIDAQSQLVTFPRPYVIPLFEELMELSMSEVQTPIIG